MATTYTTVDGDQLDRICWKHYGSTDDRIVERVLDHNQGLADEGLVYRTGLAIELPDLETEAQDNDSIHLWD